MPPSDFFDEKSAANIYFFLKNVMVMKKVPLIGYGIYTRLSHKVFWVVVTLSDVQETVMAQPIRMARLSGR